MRYRTLLVGPALVVALGLAACGGDDDGGSTADREPTTARQADFPKAAGKTLAELRAGLGPGPVLAPSVSLLEPGTNRFGFGLFDRARKQIADAPVALYLAPTGGGPARGPFPARYESLEVKPQFQSRSAASDPDGARSVYVADLPVKASGDYEVLGVVRLDNRLVSATSAAGPLRAVAKSPVPGVGDRAPKVSTPTKASVAGDVAEIDTRQPPSTMHESDLADVLGKKPVVLLFATPALCQSRVCGPVVDIAEEVKAEHGSKAEFIHMEIYKDNELKRGCAEGKTPAEECFRPQVLAYRLTSEPFLFVIDRSGRVAARLEGAFSKKELTAALAKAT